MEESVAEPRYAVPMELACGEYRWPVRPSWRVNGTVRYGRWMRFPPFVEEDRPESGPEHLPFRIEKGPRDTTSRGALLLQETECAVRSRSIEADTRTQPDEARTLVLADAHVVRGGRILVIRDRVLGIEHVEHVQREQHVEVAYVHPVLRT